MASDLKNNQWSIKSEKNYLVRVLNSKLLTPYEVMVGETISTTALPVDNFGEKKDGYDLRTNVYL